jgi:hypothetical protein
MKRHFIVILFVIACSLPLEARVNILETWVPGINTTVNPVDTYELRGTFRAGEYLYEVPAEFDYVAVPNLEVGGRWGIISNGTKMGINDLMIGAKYLLVDGAGTKPAIVTEAALSLPTADYASNLGTGGVGLFLHWAMQKSIQDVNAYFGLGIQVNSKNADDVRQGNVFYYHIGAGFPSPYLEIFTEIKGYNHTKTMVNGNDVPESDYQELYFSPGSAYKLNDRMTIYTSLLVGLTPRSHDLGISVSTNF